MKLISSRALAVLFWLIPGLAVAETWVDITGTFRIEAKMIRLENNVITLEKTNGARIEVPLERLDKSSIELARKLANMQQSVPPIGTLPDRPTVQQTIDYWNHQQLLAPDFLWEFTPKKYQSQFESYLRSFAERVDAKTWNDCATAIADVERLLRTKSDFFANSSVPILRLGKTNAENLRLTKLVSDLLEHLRKSSLLNRNAAQSFDGDQFFANEFPPIRQIGQEIWGLLSPRFGPTLGLPIAVPRMKFLRMDGEDAEVELTFDHGEVSAKHLVLVENRWFFAHIIGNLDQGDPIVLAQIELLGTEEGTRSMELASQTAKQVSVAVEQLLATKNQKQFDQQLVAGITPFLKMLQSLQGPG